MQQRKISFAFLVVMVLGSLLMQTGASMPSPPFGKRGAVRMVRY
jgi:hypothetical protein